MLFSTLHYNTRTLMMFALNLQLYCRSKAAVIYNTALCSIPHATYTPVQRRTLQ